MARPSLWSDRRAARYRRLGYWTEDTFAGLFARNARMHPARIACSDGVRCWTWVEAWRWVLGVASSLVELGFPRDAEHLLERHPAIFRAAVVPMSDERVGERVGAYLVPADGCQPSLEEVVSFLRSQRLASYKLPERVELVGSLPTTSGGKLDRQALQADLAGRAGGDR